MTAVAPDLVWSATERILHDRLVLVGARLLEIARSDRPRTDTLTVLVAARYTIAAAVLIVNGTYDTSTGYDCLHAARQFLEETEVTHGSH